MHRRSSLLPPIIRTLIALFKCLPITLWIARRSRASQGIKSFLKISSKLRPKWRILTVRKSSHRGRIKLKLTGKVYRISSIRPLMTRISTCRPTQVSYQSKQCSWETWRMAALWQTRTILRQGTTITVMPRVEMSRSVSPTPMAHSRELTTWPSHRLSRVKTVNCNRYQLLRERRGITRSFRSRVPIWVSMEGWWSNRQVATRLLARRSMEWPLIWLSV